MLKNNKELIEYLRTHTIKETCYEFKIKENALRAFVRREGLPFRRSGDIFDDVPRNILVEFCKDKTIKEIAEHYNVSVASARAGLEKRGVFFKKGHTRNQRLIDREQMIRFLAKEFSYQSIALQFGVSRQRIEQIVNKEKKCVTQ